MKDETKDVVVEMPVMKTDEPNKNMTVFPSDPAMMEDYLRKKGLSEEEIKEAMSNTTKSSDDTSEHTKAIEDEENPLNETSQQQLGLLIKEAKTMVDMMESNWRASEQEFGLKDSHMRQLYQFNLEHRKEKPENISEEENNSWDSLNGLDALTEEDVVRIFGEDHPIIGIEHTVTMDRIKDISGDFFNWLNAIKEYNEIQAAYMELIESEEEKEIEKLKIIMENETDPDKKANMKSSIDLYYSNKYLDFLAEEMSERDHKMIIDAYGDSKKLEYWLNRAREKMKQLRVNEKFILEISQFEKRFLPEKYHVASNMLLLYFIKTITYANASNPKDLERTRSMAMVICLDSVVRNILSDEKKQRVLDNIMKYLDMFIDEINERYNQNQ